MMNHPPTLEAAEAVIAVQAGQIARQDQRIAQLVAQINALRRRIFGPATEITAAELRLMDANQQVIDPAWLGDCQQEKPAPVSAESAPAKPSRPPRQGLAQRCPLLPIEESDQPLPPAMQAEVDAGTAMARRTGTYHDELVVPGVKAVIKRIFAAEIQQVARPGIITAVPATPRIAPGSELADVTIIRLMVGKFLDAMPINRQVKAWERDGIDLSRQTANANVLRCAELLAPLAAAIRAEVLTSDIVHADESWFRLRDHELDRKCRRVNVWTLVGGGQVSYHYTADRTHQRAEEVVGKMFAGFLVRDEWQGWARLDQPTQAGCNAHARRPFARLQDEHPRAAEMVALYGKVYAIEADCRATGRSGEDLWRYRREERQRNTAPLMDEIKNLAKRIDQELPPSHELAVGARYITTHWERLTLFLKHGELPPDNNLAENCLRINALIRKNSLFFGSPDGGTAAATALTVLHSCRLMNIDVMSYMRHVTTRLLAFPKPTEQEFSGLTPKAYAATMAKTKTG